jgi:signal peptidase I
MLAVFRPGDYLILEPADLNLIRRGDVIVFNSPDAEAIVHRVIAVLPEGLGTCGDNNAWPDRELVDAHNLMGRVIALERGGRRIPVHGGEAGLQQARRLRFSRHLLLVVWQRLLLLGHLPWRWLRASRLAIHLWHPKISRVQFAVKDSVVIKYIYAGKTVACWWPESKIFRCSHPFDLIIFGPDPT